MVGLSGGADSVALTDALASLRRRRGFRLVAAHLDHGLRPGSADDAAFCHAFCEALGVPLRGGTAPVRERAFREKGGLEQAARRERYSFLRRVKDDEGAALIAVAHTQDDQAETLLLRLLRGAGATGLAGMRPRSGDLLRPLLGVSRAKVLEHLARARARVARGPHERRHAAPAQPRASRAHSLSRAALQPARPRGARPHRGAPRGRGRAHGDAGRSPLARIATRDDAALVLDRQALGAAPAAVARATLRLALQRAGGLDAVDQGHVERVLGLARAARRPGDASRSRAVAMPRSRTRSSGSKGVPRRPRKPYHRPGRRR